METGGNYMKQNITVDDLNQLSEKGKKSLRNWWKPQEGDLCYRPDQPRRSIWLNPDGDIKGVKDFFLPIYPLLSIGQMIEFLGKRWIEYIRYVYDPKNELYKLEDSFDDIYIPNYEKLCDELWEAVKEVLEQ